MSSQNSSIALLSFDRFWSTDGTHRQKSFCALIVTLFIFFLILAIFIYQLINVFSFRTVDAEQFITYAMEPPVTPLNTFTSANDPTSYMMALSVLHTGCAANSSVALQAFYSIKSSTSTVPT